MKRRVLVLTMIGFPLIMALLILRLPVDAASPLQLIRDTRPTPVVGEPLTQPLAVQIRQQLPMTLTIGSDEEAGDALTQTVPLTLALDLRLSLTRTLTSTVASTVTLVLTLPDGATFTFPLSLTLGQVPSTTVVVTPLTTLVTATETSDATETPTATDTPSPTPTEALTPTETLTPTLTPTETAVVSPTTEVSPTVVSSPTLPSLSSTVNITANLRSGPGVLFEIVGQAGLGQPVTVVAVSADGAWYLLDNGAWIAVGLVDNAPANPPTPTPSSPPQRQ
jgi:hypothetical protein